MFGMGVIIGNIVTAVVASVAVVFVSFPKKIISVSCVVFAVFGAGLTVFMPMAKWFGVLCFVPRLLVIPRKKKVQNVDSI